jgi:hypothetical protein
LDVGIGSRHHTDPNAVRRLDAVWFEHAGSVLQVVPNHSYTKIGHDESLAIAVNGSLLLHVVTVVIPCAAKCSSSIPSSHGFGAAPLV